MTLLAPAAVTVSPAPALTVSPKPATRKVSLVPVSEMVSLLLGNIQSEAPEPASVIEVACVVLIVSARPVTITASLLPVSVTTSLVPLMLIVVELFDRLTVWLLAVIESVVGIMDS
jgi:hypothetical protein